LSKISLSGNPSGTGTFTIAAPNSDNSRTMALPDSAGDVVVTQATQTLTNKTLTSPAMTTPTIDSAQLPTVSGTAPLYMCRAWVNFNGTGTVAIRASGNVSSITDLGTGQYRVNFATAMPDANYAAGFTCDVIDYGPTANNYTTTSFDCQQFLSDTNVYGDVTVGSAFVFR
jgi:hypothetical protein